MRTIREIIGNDEKVWLYISNADVWEKFTAMAAEEGFGFGDLPVEKWAFGYVVAVHSDGNMGHVPLFVWCRSFGSDALNCPKKIEFGKLFSGDADTECKSSHFKMYAIAETMQ